MTHFNSNARQQNNAQSSHNHHLTSSV